MPIPRIIGNAMTLTTVSCIPTKCINPTIQITPATRGIMAIVAYLKLRKSSHNNKNTTRTVRSAAFFPSLPITRKSSCMTGGIPVALSLILFKSLVNRCRKFKSVHIFSAGKTVSKNCVRSRLAYLSRTEAGRSSSIIFSIDAILSTDSLK